MLHRDQVRVNNRHCISRLSNNEFNFRDDTNFSFAWTIENFGRKMEVYKNGECLTSDTFKVEVEGVETAWKLECFPNGKQKIGEPTDCKNIYEV